MAARHAAETRGVSGVGRVRPSVSNRLLCRAAAAYFRDGEAALILPHRGLIFQR